MGLMRRGRYIINFRAIGKFLLLLLSTLFYCEYLHYFVVIHQCSWPPLVYENEDSSSRSTYREPLRAMVLADTHLLGKRSGHWFDKLRREWQMKRAFQTTMYIHQPDVVIFLGDLFDEGKWAKTDEFREYVDRFHYLFHLPNNTDSIIAAGNHDMGFHYSLYPQVINQFDDVFNTTPVQVKEIKGVNFIVINSMAMHGDNCFLCRPAENEINIISRQLECAKGNTMMCKQWHNPILYRYSRPVILQHFPMYRESDELCDEPDEAPPEDKILQFREKWECLSKQSSDMLLEKLQPRLVLSGHTHHGCRTEHSAILANDETIIVKEYSIPSFSWRNKKNPTFSMISITNNNYSVYKCEMPRETSVYCFYVISFIFALYWSLRRKIKLQSFVYSKFTKVS